MYIYFGAGCFWGVEAEFRKLNGVVATSVGYMGGIAIDPSYEEVCTDLTGHAEVVEVEFDEKIVSFQELLDVFMNIHDPKQLNRQGPDVGSQYRSVIFFTNKEQEEIALKKIAYMNKEMNNSVVTDLKPQEDFYIGEDYHQKYLEKKGLASCHINLS